MSDWWEEPYRGAPPEREIRGFPRPLYSADAAEFGKTPSGRGPDCLAYKRIVCRLGRWGVWDPASWDDGYWDAFAHGKNGSASSVANSGIAGVQRQQGIDATGWLGQKTFNALCYALIPDAPGFMHPGEHAMDAVAADLINEAWEMFGDPETPAPTPRLSRRWMPSPNFSSRGGSTVRLIVLHTAEGALSIRELGDFFAQPSSQVSSHVGIDDELGVVGEYVKRGMKAWAAKNANPVAVHAELCAFARWTTSEWKRHPNMLENCARWIAEEAEAFGIPIVRLTPAQAQGTGRGVCQHVDLGAWGGGHTDCGLGFPMNDVLERAREISA